MGDLLVGTSTSDDAAVIRIAGDLAIAQTVDFFTPIVDDPYLFGQIAAANAISDIYAMGATPILGLAIAGFPKDKLPLETLHEILRGGADKAKEAGFPVAGGHTIIDDVPKYGLVVTGVVSVDRLVRNSTARAGDLLYLTKPIGTGILVAAYRGITGKGLDQEVPDLSEAIRWMTMLNRDAAAAMTAVGVSAATDVTGYGLIGHLLEMCEGSGVGAELSAAAVPILPQTADYLAKGFCPGGTKRNVGSFRRKVQLSDVGEETFTLFCDAQTSGGLLMAVPSERRDAIEARFADGGLFYAKIGKLTTESGSITIVP